MFDRPFKFLAILIMAMGFNSAFAQKLTQFSTDTTKFTKDLSQYFQENSANKEQAADYIRDFEKLWKENIIAGYYKEVCMSTANTMLARRMKPYPFFHGYLNTVVNSIA